MYLVDKDTGKLHDVKKNPLPNEGICWFVVYIYVVSVLENLKGNCWFKELNMLIYKKIRRWRGVNKPIQVCNSIEMSTLKMILH